MENEKQLGLFSLVSLIVGAIIGSGIFSLPQNMAQGAGAGAMLIAWGITFVGMFALSQTFQWLSTNAPEIEDGLYGYAKHGFGEYLGFNAAWGYWVSVWIGNAGYLVVMFSALGAFPMFSIFGNGTTPAAIVCEIAILWMLHLMVLQGVRSAALINTLVTVAKIVPLGLFILCVVLAFNVHTFNRDFWGTPALGSVMEQVKSTMLFTVWVFLGIESAAIYASRAKKMADVGRATLIGFALTMVLLVCVSVLSLGVIPQSELAHMKNPSMAWVLARVLGPVGADIINISLIVAVGGALLAWTMLGGEMLYLASRGDDNTIPAIFGHVNDNGAPTHAMTLTNVAITVMLILTYFNENGYNALVQLSTSMALIPYLLCAGFGLRLSNQMPSASFMARMLNLVAVCYGLWLIYAAGLKYLMLSMVLYAPGLLFFARAKLARSDKLFDNSFESGVCMLIVVLGILAGALVFAGGLSL
ncbi:basic amino acid/polyamine antiporter [Paludibacterium purpuratum]|uniref:Arginine:ornithine antiporter (APA family) n=1 Tax=Paludibacterium purpuratum TaxID=1144873 RepID=A0A4R7B9H2_9NEIS|nr:basic amino acid/polyamine antiporter [Paludibacterium purpuratum]TDR80237.1 arginine:ornithine antiporter (APA family) [Paludibacterium purpuratum]